MATQGFSAVCWYFGKALADDPAYKDVPIGLVGTFVGGTYIEQWIRAEKQAACDQTLCGTSDLEHYKCENVLQIAAISTPGFLPEEWPECLRSLRCRWLPVQRSHRTVRQFND